MDYKADITLNERDTLYDMLSAEKNLVKVYSTVMTEGCSKGFRNLIRNHWNETTTDQLDVFLLLTHHDYARVDAASEEMLNEVRQKFKNTTHQLS